MPKQIVKRTPKRFTVDDVMRCKPCMGRKQVEKRFGTRKTATVWDVVNFRMCVWDKTWLIENLCLWSPWVLGAFRSWHERRWRELNPDLPMTDLRKEVNARLKKTTAKYFKKP